MSIRPQRFTWYDVESTGLSSHHDQIIQFAGIATDADLNLIEGDELIMDIQLRPDVVPSPHAFAVHNISLERLRHAQVNELQAAGLMRSFFMDQPDSMMIGFNSQSFDDEMVRNTFYRNMLDSYEHEWKNNNSRGDLFRLVMLVHAVRPETLVWPTKEDGSVSLKLGDLCEANGITLDNAHDARSDVIATIELAKLVKNSQPKLFDYFLDLSDKKEVKNTVEKRHPLVLVDRFLPRSQGHMSLVLPIIYDINSPNKMHCINLRFDPTDLLSYSPEEIKRRCFTPVSELGDDAPIVSIRDITTNKAPLIISPAVFKNRPDLVVRSELDLEQCYKHKQMIDNDPGFRERLQQAMVGDFGPAHDSYQGIYSMGFIGRDEQSMRTTLLAKPKTRSQYQDPDCPDAPQLLSYPVCELKTQQSKHNQRAFDLALRAKWASFGPQLLSSGRFEAEELREWINHLEKNLHGDMQAKYYTNVDGFSESMNEVRSRLALNPEQEKLLSQLQDYVLGMEDNLVDLKARYALEVSAQITLDDSEVEQEAESMGKPDIKTRSSDKRGERLSASPTP